MPDVYAPSWINWSAYDKIRLNPVIIWDGFSSQLSREQEEDLNRLANSFYDMRYQ